MTYQVVYTNLARAFLGDSLAAFEERLRGELADEVKAGVDSLMFYSMEYDGRTFVVVGAFGGAEPGTVRVDTATYEDSEPLDAGPFKGRRVSIPRPDSSE